MPKEITPAIRSRIARDSALGYTQQEIGERLDLSRNTVRKYQQRIRATVEEADDPARVLAAIIENRYDWDRPNRSPVSLGDHPM